MTRHRGVTMLCLCLLAVPAAAQEARPAVSERITVTQVEIPVQVLRKGEPVRGLTADDFEVLDRGEPRPIVSFQTIDVDEEGGSLDEGAGRSAEPRDRGRHLLLLFDLDLTDWRNLPGAIGAARQLISEQLRPADRVAVGFYSFAFGAQLLHGFLSERGPSLVALDLIEALVDRDAERLGECLVELSESTGLGFEGRSVDARSGRQVARQWLASISRPAFEAAGLASRADVGSGLNFSDPSGDPVRQQATEHPSLAEEPIIRRVRELGIGLRDLATRLAAVPDPKQILFLSQGFPSRFLDAREHTTRIVFRLETALKAFLETGWVMQAIDVRGVPSIDEPGFDGNALFHLAYHSGGALYENFNRLAKATEKVVERTSVTYLLVIQPNVAADGSFHRLEVRLRSGRRAELHYRPEYRAPVRSGRPRHLDRRQDITELALSDAPLEDFPVDLLAVPVPAVGGRARVPVVVEIPGEVLLERPFADTASVEVHAYGLDGSGGVEDLFIRRVDIDLGREARRLERGGLRLAGHLELGAGPAEVRVLVRNLADDALSRATVALQIVDLDPASLVVLPPLFLDRSRDWLSMSLEGEDEEPAADLVTLADLGVEFFPWLVPRLRDDREQEVVFNLFYSTEEAPLLELRLLTARGEEIEMPAMHFVQRYVGESGATGLVANWKPKGLEPGGYTLEVALVDRATGRRVTGSQRFKIVEPS